MHETMNQYQISELYELRPDNVNGRPYFKYHFFGIWWDGVDSWWFGLDSQKGESMGFAYYEKDVFCPHLLSESGWIVKTSADTWGLAGNGFGINCKFTLRVGLSELFLYSTTFVPGSRNLWLQLPLVYLPFLFK